MGGVAGAIASGIFCPLGNRALNKSSSTNIIPTAFFNGVFTPAEIAAAGGTYTGGPTAFADNLGALQTAPSGTPALQGMRFTGGAYFDTTSTGLPLLPSVNQPTRTFDAGFTTSTPAANYKKYTRVNPAVDLPGYLCEPARTNKVTCRKANPVDTSGVTKSGDAASVLSVVDDTAALTAAGLMGVCSSGKVYKLDNSAGSIDAYARIDAPTGNTNIHSYSAFARSTTSTGGSSVYLATMDLNTFTTIVGPSYAPYKVNGSAIVNISSKIGLGCAAGHTVYFILPQLEEGAFATSPIAKLADGSEPLTAITRQGTVLSFPTAGKIRNNDVAFLQTIVPRATGQSGIYVFGNYTDTNNYTAVIVDATTVTYRKRIAGANTDATVSITHAKDIALQILRVGASTGMQIAARTYSGGAWSAWTNGELNSSDGAKANAIIAANYQLGALNSASQFTGNLSEIDTRLVPNGIADPLSWAKQQFGVA